MILLMFNLDAIETICFFNLFYSSAEHKLTQLKLEIYLAKDSSHTS